MTNSTKEELASWYDQMLVIRGTEKAAYDLFMTGLVKGTTHLASGRPIEVTITLWREV